MKKLLIFGSAFALILTSCSNESTSTTSDKDSVTNETNETVNTTTPSSDTGMSNMNGSNMSSNMTMMQNMQKMMDDMKGMQSSGNPDNDFASMMKAHHLAAIEMAQMEVSKGGNAEMKVMAQKMIDDQQKEVAEFNTFLSGHDAHGGGDAFFKEAMSIMSNMKMEMDNAGSMDKQFAQMMLSHHQVRLICQKLISNLVRMKKS